MMGRMGEKSPERTAKKPWTESTPWWDEGANDGPLIFLVLFVGIPWAIGGLAIIAGIGWLVLHV